MTAQTLLDRLDKVRPAGPNKWTARCPAHDDNDPSLAIEIKGGKVLVHCFAGCGGADVVAAVGLTFAALSEHAPDQRAPWWADMRKPEPLKVREARNILQFVQADQIAGKAISERSKREFLQALKTIKAFESKKEISNEV